MRWRRGRSEVYVCEEWEIVSHRGGEGETLRGIVGWDALKRCISLLGPFV